MYPANAFGIRQSCWSYNLQISSNLARWKAALWTPWGHGMVGKVKYLWSFSGQELLRLYLLFLIPVTGLWCPKVGITLQLIAHPCFKAPVKPSPPYRENTTSWMLCQQAKQVLGPTTLKLVVVAARGDGSMAVMVGLGFEGACFLQRFCGEPSSSDQQLCHCTDRKLAATSAPGHLHPL